MEPRKTFTRVGLEQAGQSLTGRLVEEFYKSFPEIHIEKAVKSFIPVLEFRLVQINAQLIELNKKVETFQSQINHEALALSAKRTQLYEASEQIRRNEQSIIASTAVKNRLLKENKQLQAQIEAEIISRPDAKQVEVKNIANYRALSDAFVKNQAEIKQYNQHIQRADSSLLQHQRTFDKLKAELSVSVVAGNHSNNEEMEPVLQATITFTKEIETAIRESETASIQLNLVNKRVATLLNKKEQVDAVLHSINAFSLQDPAVSVDAIENLIARLRSLDSVGMEDAAKLFQPLETIAEFIARNKTANSDQGSLQDLYVREYHLNPRKLLSSLVNQVTAATRKYDDAVLHNQSVFVRTCIVTLTEHAYRAAESLKKENGFANDEAVRAYYRKLLYIAQLYHLRLTELRENYLANLIDTEVLCHHFLFDKDIIDDIRANDISGEFGPVNIKRVNKKGLSSLDVEPVFDLCNRSQLHTVEPGAYSKASKELDEEIARSDQNNVLVQMVRLFKEVVDEEYKQSVSSKSNSFDLKFHTNWLLVTKGLLREPAKYIDKFCAMFAVNTSGKPNISRRKKSIALAVIGAAIFAGGITLGALSLGVLSPVSIAVMSVGVGALMIGIAAALSTRQKGIDRYGECVKDISIFNQQRNVQPQQLQLSELGYKIEVRAR